MFMYRHFPVCMVHFLSSVTQKLWCRQGASQKHTKKHTLMQKLMQKHRYAHRGQLWANNSVEMKPCTPARAYRCISIQNPENTWLYSDSNAEHCNWPDNRWAARGKTHRNVFTCSRNLKKVALSSTTIVLWLIRSSKLLRNHYTYYSTNSVSLCSCSGLKKKKGYSFTWAHETSRLSRYHPVAELQCQQFQTCSSGLAVLLKPGPP